MGTRIVNPNLGTLDRIAVWAAESVGVLCVSFGITAVVAALSGITAVELASACVTLLLWAGFTLYLWHRADRREVSISERTLWDEGNRGPHQLAEIHKMMRIFSDIAELLGTSGAFSTRTEQSVRQCAWKVANNYMAAACASTGSSTYDEVCDLQAGADRSLRQFRELYIEALSEQAGITAGASRLSVELCGNGHTDTDVAQLVATATGAQPDAVLDYLRLRKATKYRFERLGVWEF